MESANVIDLASSKLQLASLRCGNRGERRDRERERERERKRKREKRKERREAGRTRKTDTTPAGGRRVVLARCTGPGACQPGLKF